MSGNCTPALHDDFEQALNAFKHGAVRDSSKKVKNKERYSLTLNDLYGNLTLLKATITSRAELLLQLPTKGTLHSLEGIVASFPGFSSLDLANKAYLFSPSEMTISARCKMLSTSVC